MSRADLHAHHFYQLQLLPAWIHVGALLKGRRPSRASGDKSNESFEIAETHCTISMTISASTLAGRPHPLDMRGASCWLHRPRRASGLLLANVQDSHHRCLAGLPVVGEEWGISMTAVASGPHQREARTPENFCQACINSVPCQTLAAGRPPGSGGFRTLAQLPG